MGREVWLEAGRWPGVVPSDVVPGRSGVRGARLRVHVGGLLSRVWLVEVAGRAVLPILIEGFGDAFFEPFGIGGAWALGVLGWVVVA